MTIPRFYSLQCVSSSGELGEDAVPQPSKLRLASPPLGPVVFALLVPPQAAAAAPSRRQAPQRSWQQRAVHVAVAVPGRTPQPGALPARQAAVALAVPLPGSLARSPHGPSSVIAV